MKNAQLAESDLHTELNMLCAALLDRIRRHVHGGHIAAIDDGELGRWTMKLSKLLS